MTDQDFPVSEFQARLERLQSALRDAKIDALFLNTEAEVRYYTGFRTLFWQSPTRPWYLVLPAKGEPVAIIPEIGADLMRKTWVKDIRTWPSPRASDEGLSLLAGCLNKYARIGILSGRETHLRLPLSDFGELKERCRGCEFVDVSDIVRTQRMTKSALEIEKLATICGIASRSFERSDTLFHEGQTLKQAFAVFRIDLISEGADDVPYLVGGAGPGGYGDVISPPTDRRLANGDILMLDTGATRDGYFCDFDRNFAVGHADDDAKRAYSALHSSIDTALAIARPGVTCSELFKVMATCLGSADSSVGRFGHGLGIQLTEPPSLIDFDETALQAGMVITLEPSLEIAPGKMMVHEENIVIEDGPPRLLSTRAEPELPVIGG
ncbi:MAG: Xaa-Pro peptidase family protein [Pseudomonadota bacterium]